MQAFANLFAFVYWPLWVGCGYLFFVAVLFRITGRVPNAVTFTAIGAAWLVAALEGVPGLMPPLGGDFSSSLICTMACPVMLLKAYKIGLGAGCLKAQMGLGAWIGCALPIETALIVSVFATLIGGATMAVLWIIAARLQKVALREISLSGAPSSEGFQFPAQIPLSLGSIGGTLLAFVISAQGPNPIAAPAAPQAAAAQVGGIN